MLSYMDYAEKRFYQLSNWDENNFYPKIIATASDLLDFSIPDGPSLIVSSNSTNRSCTSYTLSNLGLANGSISYLYSSRELEGMQDSANISLQEAVKGYKFLPPLRHPRDVIVNGRPTLLYGRVYFPGNRLDAMLIKRFSPISQLLVKCVSDQKLRDGGVMTFSYQKNLGKFTHEWIYSTYDSLLGFRGLYNVAFEERMRNPDDSSRLSIGMELFWGLLNKSPGISTALRYTTQSAYTGTPLTLTVLSNPLMGHISATYSLRTTALSSFASRFDFNIYSYISDLTLGCELWRKSEQDYDNAFKMSTSLGKKTLKLIWAGRFGNFLINTGIGVNLAGPNLATTNLGIEFQFFS